MGNKQYECPEMQLVLASSEDVVVTSNGGGTIDSGTVGGDD